MEDTTLTSSLELPTNLRAVIAAGDAQVLNALHQAMTAEGHEVIATAASVTSAASAFTLTPNVIPHAAVVDAELPDGGGVQVAREVVKTYPSAAVVLFSRDPRFRLADEDLTTVAGLVYLPEPLGPADFLVSAVRLAVARCGHLEVARQGRFSAEEKLEARKLIERAKGMLMRRTGCDEREAYRMLQRASQDGRTPMVAIARTVIAGG